MHLFKIMCLIAVWSINQSLRYGVDIFDSTSHTQVLILITCTCKIHLVGVPSVDYGGNSHQLGQRMWQHSLFEYCQLELFIMMMVG